MAGAGDGLIAYSHAVLMTEGDSGYYVALVRDITNGRVRYHVPGVEIEQGETPGHAAARAASRYLDVTAGVDEVVYADTESGNEHFYFIVRDPSGPSVLDHAHRDGVELISVSALLGHDVDPYGLALRIARRGQQ